LQEKQAKVDELEEHLGGGAVGASPGETGGDGAPSATFGGAPNQEGSSAKAGAADFAKRAVGDNTPSERGAGKSARFSS